MNKLTKEQIAEAIKNPEIIYTELETWSKHEGNDGGFSINWGVKNVGFGQLSFGMKEGKVICYTECMSEEFCKKILEKFFSNCIITHS